MELYEKYPFFHYRKYEYYYDKEFLNINYEFEITDLDVFTTSYKIPFKNIINSYELDKMIFYLGLIESLSYYKLTCSKNYFCDCGFIDDYEEKFLKKIIKNGLGEFYYINNLDSNKLSPIIKSQKNDKILPKLKYFLNGTLIPVGGGKDSIVSIEILKNKFDVCLFLINDLPSCLKTKKESGLDSVSILRNFDKKIIFYNEKGFYNGHTPFSAAVAFSSCITALINGFKDIALSNESSANESSILDSDVNHQYSKSFEFEKDFRDLIGRLNTDLNYFSFLRPLSEIQITKLFASYTNYHHIFSSCNRFSSQGKWCLKCPKCLFVFIMLSAFLKKERLLEIFKENLYDDKNQLENFEMLCGIRKNKPFECVGTVLEVNVALQLAKDKFKNSFLIDRYLISEACSKYECTEFDFNHLGNEHFLDEKYFKLLKEKFN